MTIPSNAISAPSSKKKHRWKSKTRLQKASIVFVLICASVLATNFVNRAIHYRSITGTAEKRNSNGQEYWHIQAENYYDLGYLTGKSVWREIWELKQILWLLAPSFDISYQTILFESKKFLSEIPEKYLNEFHGIADGAAFASGLPIDFDDILIQNVWFDAFYGQILPTQQGPVGCTAIAAIDKQNKTVGAQNFDFNLPFQKALRFVSHQVGNGPRIFSLRLGGSISMPMAISSNGLMLLVSLVQQNLKANISMPILCVTRQLLEDHDNSWDAAAVFLENTKGATLGLNLLIFDENEFIAIEGSPAGFTFVSPDWVVKTNTYQTEAFQEFLVDPIYSKDRQAEVEELIEIIWLDGTIQQENLFSILTQRPNICREATSKNGVATLAFLSWNQFCIGNPSQIELGTIPPLA
jgi:hypothetical protein